MVMKLWLKKMVVIFGMLNSFLVSGDVLVLVLDWKLYVFLGKIICLGKNFKVVGFGVVFVWINMFFVFRCFVLIKFCVLIKCVLCFFFYCKILMGFYIGYEFSLELLKIR